ncbi:hypothetical protein K469DRAFT_602507 [Zopfia rhizophila CBS 207.26]|uniref:Ubiquitin-domain-containing protein n=1 Tax=Zopfia rhizophila CBS 207.26 TaxID=1314779 RepID=A0A6A6DDW7_9PEZI|nr:hypothetical protein K469DRAFT_602507 [Zopfia rhizophila CBS 207.26]
MADDAAASTEDAQVTFNIKSGNDQKYVITVPAIMTVADLKAKLSTSEYADLPIERQRLIYSGRVLKDPDTLASAKIKDGHTVHLVKGAASNARQNPVNQGASASGTSSPAPQIPTMATGTGNNPLAGLTGARYAGFHGLPGADMFGPDGGMGPPPDQEQLLEMMENPMFLSQMNEAMNNPAVIEMMTQNPMIRNNPMLADMLRDPAMRRLMFNPEMMRMQLQMQRAMNNSGPRFPAPGVTDTTPQTGSTATGDSTTATPTQPNTTGPTQTPQDPFASLFGAGGLGGGAGAGAGAGANPFASLFGPSGANPFTPQPQAQNNDTTPNTGTDANANSNSEATQNTGSTGTNTASSEPPPNPFTGLFGAPPTGAGADGQQQANPLAEMTRQMMQNPEAMRSAMQMLGLGQPGASPFSPPANPSANPSGTNTTGTGTQSSPPNPFAALLGNGGLGGMGGFSTPPPQDNRPPEEVYESQLRQLNEMGFYEFERNVQALRRSGGNVQAAIQFLLDG